MNHQLHDNSHILAQSDVSEKEHCAANNSLSMMKSDLAIEQEIELCLIKTSFEQVHMRRLIDFSATVPNESTCACCGSNTMAIPSVLDRITTQKERLKLVSVMIATAQRTNHADNHLLALEFILNLSRWKTNKFSIYSSSNTMSYLLERIDESSSSKECIGAQASHSRQLALMVLNNIAICPRVAARMARDASLMLVLQGIIDSARFSEQNQDCCAICVNALSNMAVWDFCADALLILHPLCLSHVVQMVLTFPAQNMSETLQVAGFRFIAALTVHAHYRAFLAQYPLLLSATMKCAQNGSLFANSARRLALLSLANLALVPENGSLLFACEFYVSKLVQLIIERSEVTEYALKILINLALWPENRTRLFNDPHVRGALMNLIDDRSNNALSTRQMAIRVLVGITAEPGLRHAIYSDQNLLDIIIYMLEHENDGEMKEHAAVFLVFLSYCEENRMMMLENHRMSRHLLEWAISDRIPTPYRIHGLVALDSLALNPKNKKMLLANLQLMNALMQIALDRTQLEEGVKSDLLNATEELLGCLGIWRKHVEFNKVIVILCSVHDIPRLGVSNSFQCIHKDLIRALAGFAHPD